MFLRMDPRLDQHVYQLYINYQFELDQRRWALTNTRDQWTLVVPGATSDGPDDEDGWLYARFNWVIDVQIAQ